MRESHATRPWAPAASRVGTVLREQCRNALVGVYLHGSAALGGFVPHRSDLDIIAVAHPSLDREALVGLGEALLEVDTGPATGLEVLAGHG